MNSWLYGFMALWIYGFMALWIHGFMDSWLYGFMDSWLYKNILRKIIGESGGMPAGAFLNLKKSFVLCNLKILRDFGDF